MSVPTRPAGLNVALRLAPRKTFVLGSAQRSAVHCDGCAAALDARESVAQYGLLTYCGTCVDTLNRALPTKRGRK